MGVYIKIIRKIIIAFCLLSIAGLCLLLVKPHSSSATSQNADAPVLAKIDLTEQERAWLKAHSEITVAINHGWTPIAFLSEGGEFHGVSVDYLNRMQDLLGVHFIKVLASDNSMTEVADVIAAIPSNKFIDSKHYVLLDQPYLQIPYAIYTNANENNIHSLNDLSEKRVAVYKAGALIQHIIKEYPEVQLFKVDIAEEALVALQDNKVDAYIGNRMIVNTVASLQGFDNIKEVGLTTYFAYINMAVKSDQPELQAILQKAQRALNPELMRMTQKWGTSQAAPVAANSYKLILVFCILLIAALFFWYRSSELRKRVEKQTQAANVDFLTGLPNRILFNQRLQQEVEKSNVSKLPLALMFFDLDNFKQVNLKFGHEFGDQLLIEAARRISRCVGGLGLTARFGGDEFAALLAQVQFLSSVDRVANEVLDRLAQPFVIGSEVVYLSGSIGITLYPNDDADSDTLLKHADKAMYEAKRTGGNRYHYFTPSMKQAAAERLQLSRDLRVALDEEQLLIHYQPIFDLNRNSLYKAEALVRWNHPTRGLLGPVEFISMAEDSGMINELGDWVFRQAAKEALYLREHYHPDFQISINVSPVQFQSERKMRAWIDYLAGIQLPANAVAIEITEGLLLDATETVKTVLAELRDAGAEVSIDDFGTGYSSLAYLRKFDIDYVKLDRAFVKNLSPGSYDAVLCEALIEMAHKLGLVLIAEGVETEGQLALLKQAGCDYVQGYLYSKPLPLEQFTQYLEQYKANAAV